jgi:ABC-type dipeptide/oligopeptide/nickel transport system permease component
MTNYIIRRIFQSILVLLGAVAITFVITRATGDPARLMMSDGATEQQLADFRREFGLDKPVPVQFANYMLQVLQGDLGKSIRHGTAVTGLITDKLPNTLKLTFAAMLISFLISFPMGVFVALRRNTVWDMLGTSFALLGQAAPSFWTGLMLVLVFGVVLRWLPISGASTPAHLVLPAVTLGFYLTGRMTRLIRSGMLEILGKEYIRTARSKGLLESVVVWKHALRNAAIPVVTYIGLTFADLLGGAMVIETVFAWPGIGRLVINAVLQRDFPVVQGVVLFSALIFVFVNLIVDVLYTVLDPRITYK